MELMVKMGVQGTSISQAVSVLRTQLQKSPISLPVTVTAGGGGTPQGWGAPGKRQSFADWQRNQAGGGRGIASRLSVAGAMFTSVARDSAASLASGAPITQVIAQQAPQVLQALAIMRLGWLAIGVAALGAFHYITKGLAEGLSGATALAKANESLRIRLDEVRESMKKMWEEQKKLQTTSAKSVYENATPGGKLKMSQSAAYESYNKLGTAEKEARSSRQYLDDLISGKERDQLTGEKFAPGSGTRVNAANDLAKAEEALAAARADHIEKMDRYKNDNDAVLKADLDANKKKKEAAESGNSAPQFGFQADAMAQTGLFAGSSLLFNPDLSVQQDQLSVLRSIDAKVGQNPFNQ